MSDYTNRSEELSRLREQEIERRLGEWRRELTALQGLQQQDRIRLQQNLSAEDRRLRNRVLDLISPGRRKSRHDRAHSALGQQHATQSEQTQKRGLREREEINARYAQAQQQLDRQERRQLETQEARRVRHAERQRQTIEELREVFGGYFPVRTAPERERDRDRER